MRPASPESRSPDTNQGPARSVTPPTAAEPDTTQSGPSRETTEGLVTMMRFVFCSVNNMCILSILTPHSWFVWRRTLLRYFFPPDFRIPKESVNTMSAEDLVAFPIVSTDHPHSYTEAFRFSKLFECLRTLVNCRKSISSSMRPDYRVCVILTKHGQSRGHEPWRRRAAGRKPNSGNLRRNSANSELTS